MSYNAAVYTVFIASPGDVIEERDIAREVVMEWNYIHSESRKVVLMPLGWETHSSPEMGEPPQAIINRQVADKADILVGVFWTRLGTPTETYESGTVEEIQRHISSKKPTMLYFSTREVAPDMLDATQYEKLRKFKDDCQSKGLFQSFKSPDEFREKLRRQLHKKLNEYAPPPETATTTKTQVPTGQISLSEEAEVLYRAVLDDDDGRIWVIRDSSGTEIMVGKKVFAHSRGRKEIAPWEGAIEDLLRRKLVKPGNNSGSMFEITNEGYVQANKLPLSHST